MPGTSGGVAHRAALLRGYELLEAAQDRDAAAEVDALLAEGVRRGWLDVQFLAHFARSLGAVHTGRDDADHVRRMVTVAEELGDPALLGLALGTRALRAQAEQPGRPIGDGGFGELARAAVLLESASGLGAHRVAGLIEVASGFHVRGLWELAEEYSAVAEAEILAEADPFWQDIAVKQRRAVTLNRLETALDWACALAALDRWDQAAELAEPLGDRLPDAVDDAWPPAFISALHAQLDMLTALARGPSVARLDLIIADRNEPGAIANVALVTLAGAIRARHEGDSGQAADLADAAVPGLGATVPVAVRLLALAIAAERPPRSPAAGRYAHELAALRWQTRLAVLAAMRSAIEVERRRSEHEQLREEALVDDLTGLANRRAYDRYLAAVRLRSATPDPAGPEAALRAQLTVMVIDLDEFKAVNDTFGHAVGDEVLRRIGAILTTRVRPEDLAVRLGGDEFVVVLAHDGRVSPEGRGQQVLDAIRRHPWASVAPGLTVSASVGVVRGDPARIGELIKDADGRLYQAKRDGRGRVVAGSLGPGA